MADQQVQYHVVLSTKGGKVIAEKTFTDKSEISGWREQVEPKEGSYWIELTEIRPS